MHWVNHIIFALAVITIVQARPDEVYTTRFDNINIDEILNSERLLNNYIACLKGIGKCTPDGSELKRVLPDALETECSKCSVKQKEGTKKVIVWLIEKHPDTWKELEAIYDPDGVYRTKYENYAKDAGVDVSKL